MDGQNACRKGILKGLEDWAIPDTKDLLFPEWGLLHDRIDFNERARKNSLSRARRGFRKRRVEGMKLTDMIGVAVNGLDRLDEIVPVVEDLGRRHAGYGVEDTHYDTAGAALLWTLEQGLGDEFTPAFGDAWGAAYGVLADTMKGAAPN